MKEVLQHLLLAALVAAATYTPAAGQAVMEDIPELQGIDVEQKLGDTIPLDLAFVDEYGSEVTIGDYFHRNKPVMLVLGYYRCPMLCNLVFNGITSVVPNVGLDMGREYQIVTVSIDPRETPELAAAKKENYLQELGSDASADGWAFLTGDSTTIKKLADAVGFEFYYVDERKEYAHPAVLHLLTDEGVISRYLFGIQYNPRDLKLGLLEASEGQVGSAVDKLLLYCFHYDPDAGGYVVMAQNVMTLGGAATVFLLGGFLVTLWIRDRRRRSRAASDEQQRVTVG